MAVDNLSDDCRRLNAFGHLQIVLRELRRANISQEKFLTLEQDLYVCKETIASGGGSGVVLWVETDKGCILAGNAISARRQTPESVSVEACSELLRNVQSGACVDDYLQSQFIILTVIAEGKSRVLVGPLSSRTHKPMCVAKEMTGVDFSIEKVEDTKFLISVRELDAAILTELLSTFNKDP
ncbi:hypothetical protein R1sor_019304 [Riccia sorocarpa]|uniref:Uncharacterized protein n=1 Tax=Riccia sorocarpa TaxID=122646 RepID=A0ABD3ICA1_9MARC